MGATRRGLDLADHRRQLVGGERGVAPARPSICTLSGVCSGTGLPDRAAGGACGWGTSARAARSRSTSPTWGARCRPSRCWSCLMLSRCGRHGDCADGHRAGAVRGAAAADQRLRRDARGGPDVVEAARGMGMSGGQLLRAGRAAAGLSADHDRVCARPRSRWSPPPRSPRLVGQRRSRPDHHRRVQHVQTPRRWWRARCWSPCSPCSSRAVRWWGWTEPCRRSAAGGPPRSPDPDPRWLMCPTHLVNSPVAVDGEQR